MAPPSAVENWRPSEVVTVAFFASMARTAVRFTASVKGRSCHVVPSVDNTTAPARPTIQQTSRAGDEPAVKTIPAGAACGCHVTPPSVERWIVPGAKNSHRNAGSGDAISTRAVNAVPPPPRPAFSI